MASQQTPTTLGGLEFSQIKTSLTEYLRTQNIFSGYNFEGSAIQTVIDLLSYNTFYYAYYANMINAEAFLDSAQKEASLISLCKPLGFFVPDKTSAKALVKVNGTTDFVGITAGTLFTGRNSEGIQFNFYPIDTITVDSESGNTDEFYLYEGTQYVNFDARPTFDFDKQQIAVAADNFDINTLRVTVTDVIDDVAITDEWTLVRNVGYVSQTNEKIYFVERTSTGFVIKFGGRNSLGQNITDTVTKINVRYLLSSGSAGNDIIIFENTELNGNVSVTTTTKAIGGMDHADFDDVRFLAPKWFASQERAVTVNDYKALLLEAGYFENQSEFNVFGGQDLIPQKYGRVFISSNKPFTTSQVQEFINYVKERSVITVLPEYVQPNSLSVFADFLVRTGLSPELQTSQAKSNLRQLVKNIFDTNFGVTNKFNLSFSASDFVNYIDTLDSTSLNSSQISPDDFELYVKETLSDENKEYVFNLDNELYAPLQTYTDITEPFTYYGDSSKTVVLRMFPVSMSSKNNKAQLQLWEINQTTGNETQIDGDFGYYYAIKGAIKINKNVFADTATLNVKFKNKSLRFFTNNLITFKSNTITVQ
jgi:hypothetical protein